jgi:hypothetical protein
MTSCIGRLRGVVLALACACLALPSAAIAGSDTAAKAATEVPAASLNLIEARIATYMTFQQFSPTGVVRWSPRTIELVEYVKATSPTRPETYLYAFRYIVSVLTDKESLVVEGTICQVTMVGEAGVYSDPTVGCDPVNVGRATSAR